MSAAIVLTDETFAAAIADQDGLTIVDFWAAWCGPCRALAPTIDRLVERYAGRVTFAKLDIDAHPGIAKQFQVQSIPTLLYFRGGGLLDRSLGALPEAIISAKIEELLASPAPQAA